MISFYKPNSKNTGTACSFSVNSKEGSVWSSLIKQSSWNEGTKTGSFIDNKDNPQKSAKVKFSTTEVAGLLEALDKNIEFSAYHSSDKQVTKIKFSPYIRDENKSVFLIALIKKVKKILKINNHFYLDFYFNEARLLREFLTHSLQSIFKTQEVETIKKIKNSRNHQESNKTDAEEDGELW